MNDIKVYVLSADTDFPFSMSGYEIENWNQATEAPNALAFIELCKTEGSIYSLEDFQYAFNVDEQVNQNDYIFITDKY